MADGEELRVIERAPEVLDLCLKDGYAKVPDGVGKCVAARSQGNGKTPAARIVAHLVESLLSACLY